MTNRDPILRTKIYTENGTTYRMAVHGGLHYIRGNRKPYFSLTSHVDRKAGNGRYIEHSGGCQHDLILRHFPELADLAAMHLSDMDGIPSHAKSNGWYWLAGALGGAGERYHGGNGDRQHWTVDGQFNGYRHSTANECLETFAEHWRISGAAAAGVRDAVHATAYKAENLIAGEFPDWKRARETYRAWVDAQTERLNAEAAACIKRHGLQIYGDCWKGEAA